MMVYGPRAQNLGPKGFLFEAPFPRLRIQKVQSSGFMLSMPSIFSGLSCVREAHYTNGTNPEPNPNAPTLGFRV